jgi:hypothetical protein
MQPMKMNSRGHAWHNTRNHVDERPLTWSCGTLERLTQLDHGALKQSLELYSVRAAHPLLVAVHRMYLGRVCVCKHAGECQKGVSKRTSEMHEIDGPHASLSLVPSACVALAQKKQVSTVKIHICNHVAVHKWWWGCPHA